MTKIMNVKGGMTAHRRQENGNKGPQAPFKEEISTSRCFGFFP